MFDTFGGVPGVNDKHKNIYHVQPTNKWTIIFKRIIDANRIFTGLEKNDWTYTKQKNSTKIKYNMYAWVCVCVCVS